MPFLESLYTQHRRHVERHPDEPLDSPPRIVASEEEPDDEPEPSGLRRGILIVDRSPDVVHVEGWAEASRRMHAFGEFLVEDTTTAPSDDVSDWTPDHPTWADIRAGVWEMAVGVWQGVADYLTGGRR